jgi:hypothetical protein
VKTRSEAEKAADRVRAEEKERHGRKVRAEALDGFERIHGPIEDC